MRAPAAAVLVFTFAFAAATLAAEGLTLEPAGAPGGARDGPSRASGSFVRPNDGGDAGLIVGEDESLWRLFRKGGYVMPAILIASIVALAFAIERGVALRVAVQTPKGLAGEVAARLSRGGTGAAASLVGGREGVLPRVLAATLGRLSDGRAGMEEAAAAESYRALYDLRKNVRPIGTVASIAPLLGLLGTVFGMIRAFDTASGGGLGRGRELAGGIAEALLTTGAGLVVAIPALVVYHYFRGRAEDLVRRAEAETASFIERALASRGTGARDDRTAGTSGQVNTRKGE